MAQRWKVRGVDEDVIADVQELSRRTDARLGEVVSIAIRHGLQQADQTLAPEDLIDLEFRGLGVLLRQKIR